MTPERDPAPTRSKGPSASVLVVLVTRNGEVWLRDALGGLARQTHRRLAVIAVDDASSDDSPKILTRVLGKDAVIRMPQPVGFPAAVAKALETSAGRSADYVLVVHDDTVLERNTIAQLVSSARGVEGVGIVGPKVRSWEAPDVLRELGGSADRFGYPYSPIEKGEIDHGQYDSPREVLFVSFTAMLISREVLDRIGAPDERFRSAHGFLDYCWRARLAGYRVLVEPRAAVRHREAGDRGERPDSDLGEDRYLSERAALASLLKNYGFVSLAWVLPLFLFQGLARVVLFAASRRARVADVLAAWWWNLIHLPGTLSRRVRAQAVRRVPDRQIVQHMTSAGARLKRWALQASSIIVGDRAGPLEPGEEVDIPPLRRRVAGVFAQHPIGVGLLLGVALTLISFRGVLGASGLEGGALPTFPAEPSGFFREFASGWSSHGLGGPGSASPAAAILGLGSVLALGSPALLAKLIVAVAPLVAAVLCYRAILRRIQEPRAAIIGAGCYVLSALAMWAISEGRVAVLVLLAGLPWLVIRVWEAFGPRTSEPTLSWVASTGLGLGFVGAFFPSVWIPLGLVAAVALLIPERGGSPVRGIGRLGGAMTVGAALVFPTAAGLIRTGGLAPEAAGFVSFGQLLRLSPGSAPGAWVIGFFLPIAGVIALVLTGDEHRRWAWRAALVAAAAPFLAWAAGAGYLPRWASDLTAPLAAAAFGLSLLVGLAMQVVAEGVGRHAFGYRQLSTAALALVLALGLGLQAVQAARGAWAVGENAVPPAWPVVATADPATPFRVLWIGAPFGGRFPAPGGSPEGVLSAGPASIRYGVTGKQGRSAVEIGAPAGGTAFAQLDRALRAILAGDVRHGGSLLAPFGVRFVVAGSGDLPIAVRERLALQVDLDLIQQAGGLRIYENPRVFPLGGAFGGKGPVGRATGDDLLAPAKLVTRPTALPRVAAGRFEGSVNLPAGGLVFLSTPFEDGWRLEGHAAPFLAFGWGVGFEAHRGTEALVAEFGGQFARTVALVVLAILWLGTLVVARPRRRRWSRAPGRASVRIAELLGRRDKEVAVS
ncbi:MAG: glycosyltransferase [Actinomycetota bacterium]